MQKIRNKIPVKTCVSGSRQFQRGGGGGSNCFSREVHTSFSSSKQMATYDFHGEKIMGRSGPPAPSVSASDPLFANRIMVYQSLNKTEKYHPTTTKRLLIEIASADPEGGQGVRSPGKSEVKWVSIGYKQLDPLGKSWNPLENVAPLWNLEK